MTTKISGIRRAVEMYKGSSALAAACGEGISRQNVEHWLSLNYVPIAKCPQMAIATGIAVEDLNPLHDWTAVRRALELKAA
jgi:DNA-binding transcriptional regulator YdaS (Cro superfamily)